MSKPSHYEVAVLEQAADIIELSMEHTGPSYELGVLLTGLRYGVANPAFASEFANALEDILLEEGVEDVPSVEEIQKISKIADIHLLNSAALDFLDDVMSSE